MTVYFTNPLYLLLVIPLAPLVVITGRRLMGISKVRKTFIILFRLSLFLLLVCALAGLKVANKTDDLAVFYLLDVSRSIPRSLVSKSLEWINEATQGLQQNDSAGLIVFASSPSIEKNCASSIDVRSLQSYVDENNTNLASAIRLALAAFPGYTQKKIVLISDGNENAGDVTESAHMARENKAPIYVYPLNISEKQDVRIDRMAAPQSSVKDAPFDVKLLLSSSYDTNAVLRVYKEDSLILEKSVPVETDKKNMYSVRVTLKDSGFHQFKAMIEAPGDEVPENNAAFAFSHVKDIPSVLYVEGNVMAQSILPPLLAGKRMAIALIEPAAFPNALDALLEYDCIVLSNVSTDMLTFRQMELIEKGVHDFGIGLVVIGGDSAYGPGGYQDTPIETALPVSMEVSHKKVLPNGALVIILHTCEIPSGNLWAREITLAALRVLSSKDYFGVLFYGGAGEQWLFKPEPVSSKKKMEGLIMDVMPGDMPSFDITLQMAYEELTKLNTYMKHIVIISDGDPQTPNPDLAKKIAAAKITISTVVINPHTPRDAEVMAALAKLGNGNFYYPKTSNELPKIFTKEAMIIRKSAIIEQPFTPQYVQYSEALTGFSQQDFPQLLGYVSTSEKKTATVPMITSGEDPLLAMWRYGLGKSVTFASDATTRWAQHWTQWEKFDKFWSQIIRWATRETAGTNYLLSTSTEGDVTLVVLDALDNEGYFINYLQPRAQIVDPDLKDYAAELIQVSPGKYRAEISTPKPGNYLMSINVGDEQNPQIVVGGLSTSYSPEFNDTETNMALLNEITRVSGGDMITPETEIFRHDPPSVRQPQDVWQYLVALAAVLLLVDIFSRRVIFRWSDVRESMAKGYAKFADSLRVFKPREVPAASEPTEALLKKRQELWERRGLKEQSKSELLQQMEDIKGGSFEPDEIMKKEQPATTEEETVEKKTPPEPKPEEESHIRRLLDIKRKKKPKE